MTEAAPTPVQPESGAPTPTEPTPAATTTEPKPEPAKGDEFKSAKLEIVVPEVSVLAEFPVAIVDKVADERGTREYNLALAARRAEAVRTYLINRGIPAGRIDTISYGKERPIAEGSTEDAFARNRNAHTAIVSGAQR